VTRHDTSSIVVSVEVSGSLTVVVVVVRSVVHDAKKRHCFLTPGDPALTIGCVKGGEAIDVVTSRTPFTQPIGQSDTAE
jgi:hypothetical protein